MNTSNIFLLTQMILKIPGFLDNIFTHLLAGLGAGFFAVCIGSPVDVVGILSPFWNRTCMLNLSFFLSYLNVFMALCRD